MIHLPFTFAKSKLIDKVGSNAPVSPAVTAKETGMLTKGSIYDSLKLSVMGLSRQAYNYAVLGLEHLKNSGKIYNNQLVSIIDFTKASYQKRLFVIDMEHCKLLFNTYVAHGQNSGGEFADRFSNKPESYQSSLGFYETNGTYIGKNGYSLRLTGLENGINNRADERAIVIHGAAYVSERYIRDQGHIGRSWGCPAVPEELNKPIIDKIKNGSCLFIYGKDKNYLKYSTILKS